MRFERGERFFAEGRPWAVLEYAKKRLLAVCPSSGAVREFPISKRLRKTGKVHSALIRTVDHYLETLNVGGKVHLESGPTEIVLKCSNGDLWVADGKGERLRIPKWKIEGFIAKSLISLTKTHSARESPRIAATTISQINDVAQSALQP